MEIREFVVSAVNAEGWEQTHKIQGILPMAQKIVALAAAKGVANVKLSVQSGRGLKELGNLTDKVASSKK